MFKEKHFLKIIGIFTQLLLGWIVILLFVSAVIGIIWVFVTIHNLGLVLWLLVLVFALSLFAYKIGNELIGDIYN